MASHKRGLFDLFIASLLTLCGCGQPSAPATDVDSEPRLVEEITVSGFDPDGEPVIKKWSDGSMWIHFEAMPPFFTEENGMEGTFENFETKIQDAIGVPVIREDREVFVIPNPKPDTGAEAKAWLELYHRTGS